MELDMIWQLILYICGGIVTIYGGINAVQKFFSPYKEIRDKIERHDELLESDNNRLKTIEESQRLQCKVQMVMLQHMITGDHVDKLREAQEEIEAFLINK